MRLKRYLPHKGVRWWATPAEKPRSRSIQFVPYQLIGGKWWSISFIRVQSTMEVWKHE